MYKEELALINIFIRKFLFLNGFKYCYVTLIFHFLLSVKGF